MKIYTKTGDDGETGLWGGQRVRKDALRVRAYGDIDELNATLGILRTWGPSYDIDERLARVQSELFVLGSDLATPGEATNIPRVKESYITALEQEIDQFETELAPLKQFILPGGTQAAAYAHLARTVCRRAERETVMLADSEGESLNAAVLPYLNRLSDWLFVVGRLINARAGVRDVPWQNPSEA
jgi:cob(I)alamin adenosyltransferase